ncbi:MAG: FAD:protein FMN transferase [Desulfuromonadaceae bacterium]
MSLNRPLVILLLFGVLALFALQQCRDKPQSLSRSRLLMGTVVEITVLGDAPEGLEGAVTEAFAALERVEQLMSAHFSNSDVARLNASGEAVEVSPETAAVLALGQRIAEASGGTFDMTLGRLIQLWGMETAEPHVPDPAEIAPTLMDIGPRALRIEGTRISKRAPDLQVDLGGIAKGYAVDQAIEALRRAGVTHASVNAGGDIRLLGDRQGRPWRIGIQHPRHAQTILVTLELEQVAVVTSGDYERFFERDGIRYHHLFDPRSGFPARLCQSVTVLAPSAAEADALATAAFVLGPEAGLSFIASWPHAEALLVAADGRRLLSDGLKDRVKWP